MRRFDTSSVAVLAINLLFAVTWGLTGLAKIFGGSVPDYFQLMFGETFLASFPGLTIAFWSIAIFETTLFILTVISLCRLEFLKQTYTFLKWTIVGSLLVFVQLGFGKRLIGQHDGAAELFFYFCGTLVVFIFIRSLERESSSQVA